MAREPLPQKIGMPDRVREPLSGVPRNAKIQAAILERNRAELVGMYRRSKAAWPDGIDTASDRWYGDGSGWTAERIRAALDPAVFEGDTVLKPKRGEGTE